jgi:hypothetical protein
MNIAQRSAVLNCLKWSLDKLTQHYPREESFTTRDWERIEKLADIWKRWMTQQPQTPQLAFLRACDVLQLDPAVVKRELQKLL